MTEQAKGTALITGASTGIGSIYADRLAKQGYDLILVARDKAKLDVLATRLAGQTGRKIEVFPADLTDKAALRQVEQRLRTDAKITMLVNNAGIGGIMPLLNTRVDDMERLIELNVTALTRLTYAVAPAFVERGTGTIVNIASIVGVAPEILNGAYGASKAFVLSLSHSLNHELASKGVRIQAVLPGATATDFWSLAGNPVENLPKEIVMPADAMVDASLAGLAKGELVTIPSLHKGEKWDQYEALRRELGTLFGNSTAAARYTA